MELRSESFFGKERVGLLIVSLTEFDKDDLAGISELSLIQRSLIAE
jgi:hypothetical protein